MFFYPFLFVIWAAAFAVGVPIYRRDTDSLEKRNTRWGKATWYHPGSGNCGGWSGDNDLIVAISRHLYNSDGGSNCGQYVQVIDTDNGRSAYGMVVDSCESCSDNDLDVSPALFNRLDNPNKGILSISWHFMNKGWHP